MRVLLVALAFAAVPALASAQLVFAKPADLNKDGVVTEEEQHEYDGQQAAQYRDAPPLYSPTAPKPAPGGPITIAPSDDDPEPGSLEGRAVPASDFEKTQDALARERARD